MHASEELLSLPLKMIKRGTEKSRNQKDVDLISRGPLVDTDDTLKNSLVLVIGTDLLNTENTNQN